MDLLNLLGTGNDDLYTEIIRDFLKRRVLILNQEINDDIVESFVSYIIKWNLEDKNIPVENRVPITILVNSPGGDSISGFNLVDIIKQSKTPVKAVCLGLAASMGFHIYISCHERYAFSNSILLMHDGEINISNSSSKAKDTMKFLDAMEARTKEHVLNNSSMDEEFYDKHYEQELYMYADRAKELGCVDKIVGIDCLFEDVF